MTARRLLPVHLHANVRALTIARAGRNGFKELRLFFDETGPDLYFQPNDTGRATLIQLLGDPGAAWVGRRVVLAIKRELQPGGEPRPVVAVGVPRQWYDTLEVARPLFSDNPSSP